MLGDLAFFSLAHLADPGSHRAYNEWHQLDHRPENLALPGVTWGERWVHPPDVAELAVVGDVGPFHYLNMYWFRAPVDQSRREWSELAERSLQWGRRADLALATRPMMAFFHPTQAYVSEGVAISENALPIRPNLGVYARLTRVAEPRTPAALDRFAWWDRVGVPELVARPGAAGAVTFASESTFVAPFDLTAGAPPESVRLHLVYLDADPLQFARSLAADPVEPPGRGDLEAVLFSGALRAIVPWEWSWFDPAPEAVRP
ncbi:MAG: hypothetical protein JWL73_1948 [Actinomycetia bacterium]|nr:hypothetical protein [Actinomycetes bacterium]